MRIFTAAEVTAQQRLATLYRQMVGIAQRRPYRRDAA